MKTEENWNFAFHHHTQTGCSHAHRTPSFHIHLSVLLLGCKHIYSSNLLCLAPRLRLSGNFSIFTHFLGSLTGGVTWSFHSAPKSSLTFLHSFVGVELLAANVVTGLPAACWEQSCQWNCTHARWALIGSLMLTAPYILFSLFIEEFQTYSLSKCRTWRWTSASVVRVVLDQDQRGEQRLFRDIRQTCS